MRKENYKDFPNDIMERGYNLVHLGISEYAWKKNEAEKILRILRSKKIAVLGGDVYKVSNNGVERTYDSWFINNDGTPDFIEKSITKAELYITDYANDNGEQYLYVLVF